MSHFQLSPIAIMILVLAVVPLVGCRPASGDEDWENKYETLKIENIVLKADMETAKADIAYLKSALEESKAEYDTLKADYAISKATSKKLQVDYDKLIADYDALKVRHEATKNELSEVKNSSASEPDSEVKSIPDVSPQPEEPEGPQVIKDLAYIKIHFVSSYNDDADPLADGISLRIAFYDSESKDVSFQNVPITVAIDLYGYTGPFKSGNRELVYRDKVTIDSSGGFFGTEIKIPYDTIFEGNIYAWNGEHVNTYDRYGDMAVTVTTPKQGNFNATSTLVRLYP